MKLLKRCGLLTHSPFPFSTNEAELFSDPGMMDPGMKEFWHEYWALGEMAMDGDIIALVVLTPSVTHSLSKQ